MIHAYTDGSTYGRQPAPTSWAVVYVQEGVQIAEETGAIGGQESNNRAELNAVITALESDYGDMTIVSDSLLTVNICLGVFTTQANLDLWKRWDEATSAREQRGLITHYLHVKGHTIPGHPRWDPVHSPHNNRADRLASAAGKHAHGKEAA